VVVKFIFSLRWLCFLCEGDGLTFGHLIVTVNQNLCSIDNYLFLVGGYIDELT